MANVLALVSKAGRKDIEREHGKVELGSVVGVTAYHSKHKVLQNLEPGGSLFMVTVENGKLLVVAVLHNPSFDGKSWTAAPNEVPVLDITTLVDDFEFSTGKGLKVPPEKWAMSLQTPRVLTDADVAHLRARTAPSAGSAFQSVMADHAEPPTPAKGRRRSRPETESTTNVLDWPDALATVEAWSSLTDPAKLAALEQLAAALNEVREKLDQKFTVDPSFYGVAKLGALIHEPSELVFIAVPGGAYYMGYAADDILAAMRVMSDEEIAEVDDVGLYTWAFRAARPPHLVTVRPFLSTKGLVGEESLCEATRCDDVDEAMKQLGFRYPSEAEWEWIGREGGAVQFVGLPVDRHPLGPTITPPVQYDANGWGFSDLHNETQGCADGWHEDYIGAPSTSEPWPGEGQSSRSAHTWWQSHEEAQALHAAARGYRGGGIPRLTLDVPPAKIPNAAAPAPGSTCDETLETLATRGRERTRALIAVAGTTSLAGPDTAQIAMHLLGHRDKPTKAAWLDALSLVARVAGDDPGNVLNAVVPNCFEVLREMLRDKKPAIRAAAAALLSTAPEADAGRARDALFEELEKERRHTIRAGLLLALGALGGPDLAAVLRTYVSHKEAVVRAAAVVALAQVVGPEELSDAEREQVAISTGLPAEKPSELPWSSGNLAERARALIDEFEDGDELRNKAALQMAKQAAEDKTQWQASDLALQMTFPDDHPPHTLNETQREVVRVLTMSGGTHRWGNRHLPSPLLDRLSLIGELRPPGILERMAGVDLDGTRIELPLVNAHLALFHHAAANTWSDERMADANRELFGDLTALERLEIWVQRSRGALSRDRKVDNEWRRFSLLGLEIDKDDGAPLLEAAVSEDRDGVRALVERLVQINLTHQPAYTTQDMGWTALAAVLEPGASSLSRRVAIIARISSIRGRSTSAVCSSAASVSQRSSSSMPMSALTSASFEPMSSGLRARICSNCSAASLGRPVERKTVPRFRMRSIVTSSLSSDPRYPSWRSWSSIFSLTAASSGSGSASAASPVSNVGTRSADSGAVSQTWSRGRPSMSSANGSPSRFSTVGAMSSRLAP